MNDNPTPWSNPTCERKQYLPERHDYFQHAAIDSSVASDNLDDTNLQNDFHLHTAEGKKMIEKSYLSWRSKNADLFNQQSSKMDKLRFNSNETHNYGKMENPREHLTLLNRINEISDRLERDDFDSESVTGYENNELRDYQTGREFCGDETDATSNMSLREFEQIEAMYNKVFSSDKPKFIASEVSNKYEYKPNVRQNGYDNPHLEKTVNGNFKTMKTYSPKKMVSFEERDEMPFVTRKTGSNTLENIPNQQMTAQYKQTNYGSSNKNGQLRSHPVINYENDEFNVRYPKNRCSNFPYKEENDSIALPIARYSKAKRTFSDDISRTAVIEKCSASSKQQNQSLKCNRSCNSLEREHVQCCCHHCYEATRKCKKKVKHGCNMNTDATEDSSSEGDIQADMHCRGKTYKNRKKKKITVDELYKIVKLQNEQITLLQKQIDRLLEQNFTIKTESRLQKEQDSECISFKEPTDNVCTCQQNSDKYSAQGFTVSVVQENSKIGHKVQSCDQVTDGNNLKKNCANVSIGVMTSFVEITQKMQSLTTHQCSNGTSTVPDSDQNCNNKIVHDQKLYSKLQKGNKTVEDSIRRSSCPAVAEESFTLNEVDLPALPVVVNEHVPTPQCSLHLDIQDYGSTTTPSSSSYGSSNDDSEGESDNTVETVNKNENQSDHGHVGWTLYDNVVGQINKILQTNGTNQPQPPVNPSSDEVRIATIQQLKKLGVSFMENDISTDSRQLAYEPVDNHRNGNFAFEDHHNVPNMNRRSEQMPVQFLDEDQILQAAMNIMNKRKVAGISDNRTSKPTTDGVSPLNDNTDLSFATMKYMERYRLLPGSKNNDMKSGDIQQTNQQTTNKVRNRKQKHSNGGRQNKQHLPQLQYNEQRQQNHPQLQYNEPRHQNHPQLQYNEPRHQNHPQLQYNEPRQQNHQLQYNEQRPQNLLSNKILDITALKQQPKLL